MRILYVEDSAIDADLVRRALLRSEPPPQLEVVPTLAQARAALAEPLRFDLLLADLNLPDGNGLELVAEVRRRRLPLAVVTLTGQGDEALVLAALKAGSDDYLAKSDGFASRVTTTVRAALAARRADNMRHEQPLRVLYVEHSALDIDLTRRHFAVQAPHIGLECVPDAVTALERLPHGPDEAMRFDALLLDFRLAGDTGLDVLKTLRQERGLDLPVVLVTGQGSEDVAALAMRMGATDYVVKRSNYLATLPMALENAVNRVQAAREHAAVRALNAALERRVAERTAELAAAKEMAESANRSKSTFLARMSHDLRTPLNAVLGFSQLLALDPSLARSGSSVRQLQLIHDAGRHLLAMIDDVLDLARIETGGLHLSPEAVDAQQLVHECLHLVGPLAAKHGVDLRPTASQPAGLVHADRTRLRQVLVNLLSNGIKYNRPGGQVEVTLAGGDGSVQLAVTDTGRGLTAQQLAALYQPFNRLGAESGNIEGTGLGLVIAQQLMQAMNGRIDVRSSPGSGSTFTLTLPAAAAAATPARPPSWPVELPTLSPRPIPRRVLYVEDNPLNQTLMRDLLQSHPGVELRLAGDGPSALQLAVQWQPQLVLLDLDLPGVSGYEVLRRLRADQATAALPCIAVSALALGPEIQRALDLGCVAYLSKPFELARLLDLIEQHTA